MKLTLDLGARSYDIIIKRGVLQKAGLLANLTGKVMLVTDDGVPQKYVKALAKQCGTAVVHRLPAGEDTKNLESAAGLASHLLREGFGRHDCIAAIGGGTVADIAGFASATWLHGMPLIQFPTTPTAQCDSAVGGLNNLDLDGHKNVLGTGHQPDKVIVDPDLLATLPPRYLAAGLAEVLKTALVASPELFAILEKEEIEPNLERIVCLSLLFKKGIIERDETGSGERQLLRFGNTVGQGIEAAGQPGDFLHGEAVALGMLPMIETKTLVRRVKSIMRKLGLPTKHPYSAAQLWPYIQNDATREGDAFTVTRVKTAGQGYLERITGEELQLLAGGNP